MQLHLVVVQELQRPNAIAIGGGNGDNATDNTEKTEATGEKSTAIGYNAKAKILMI